MICLGNILQKKLENFSFGEKDDASIFQKTGIENWKLKAVDGEG